MLDILISVCLLGILSCNYLLLATSNSKVNYFCLFLPVLNVIVVGFLQLWVIFPLGFYFVNFGISLSFSIYNLSKAIKKLKVIEKQLKRHEIEEYDKEVKLADQLAEETLQKYEEDLKRRIDEK